MISKEEYEKLGLQAFVGNPLVKKLKSEAKNLKRSHQQMRDEFLSDVWARGGKGFVERAEKYGRTERNTKLDLSPFYREYLECIGDFRIAHTLTLAPAQLGKTLGHTLLVCDTATVGRLSPAWFYAQFSSLTVNVGIQFQPVIEHYIQALAKDGITFNRERDRVQLQRFQIEQQTVFFSFVSTNNKVSSSAGGLATVGGAAASFTADGPLIFEERSQWMPGAADPLPRRLDASLIASKPIRELSTAGGGGGCRDFNTVGISGGSGGGAAGGGGCSPGSGTAGQGNSGGTCTDSGGSSRGGGGGGAGSAGVSGLTAGNGGGGTSSSITGSSVARAGGGGGGANSRAAGTATAGGGNGSNGSGSGTNGTANTGGGGGAGAQWNLGSSGGAGGSGVVIIRYRFQ
jgi:hypothetical protein